MVWSVRVSSFVRPILACACLAIVTAACGGSSTPTAPAVTVPFSQTDLRAGTGDTATNGKRLTVNYTGWVYDASRADQKGLQFDSSIGKTPFAFTLGTASVITGWDQGLVGMRVGGLRRLVIPPALAYGSNAVGAIPPNSTLIFDVELLGVQ
jgi:FKBP-type peptidyl-prolyl cis-trans isomerase FkpA